MITTKVTSRLPEIELEIQRDAESVTELTARNVATEAAANAPHGATGDLARGYEAKAQGKAWAVMAIWRYFFTEFGTAKASAEPHLIPAVEHNKERIDGLARSEFRNL